MSLARLNQLNARLDQSLHAFEKLDLGYTYDEMYGGPSLCGNGSESKKTQYPSLYVNRTKGDVMDIPETGKAVVEYVLTGRNMSKRDGKTTYGMDLQIKSFDPQGTKKAEAKMKKDGLAVAMSSYEFARTPLGHRYPGMDRAVFRLGPNGKNVHPGIVSPAMRKAAAIHLRGAKTMRKLKKMPGFGFSEFSDRTRNGDGQFVGNVTGGADPVTMRQAYGEKPKRSLLAPGVGAAALAGAGLLGTKPGRGMLMKGARGASRMVRSTVAGVDRKMPGKTSQGVPRKAKTGERWPVMGSKAKPKVREGLGEVIIRSAKGKTGARMPRFGD